MTGPGYRCPDCGEESGSADALVDHALAAHTRVPAPRRRRRWSLGIGTAFALAFWGLVVWAYTSETADAPQRPGSIVHELAVALERDDVIDDFRSVEPDGGWQVVYELDDGSAAISAATDGPVTQVLFENYFGGGDIRRPFERAIEGLGYRKEDDRYYLVTAEPRPKSVVAKIARELRRDGVISHIVAVEPIEGWDTEYRLDADTDLRVRAIGRDKQLDWDTSDPEVDTALARAAQRHGYDRGEPRVTPRDDRSQS